MSYRFYRFSLQHQQEWDAAQQEEALKQYQSIFAACEDKSLRRVAYDLNGHDKSITLLCKSEDNLEHEKERWLYFLSQNAIATRDPVMVQVLTDDKPASHSCGHHHGHGHSCHAHGDHNAVHENHRQKSSLGIGFGLGILLLSFSGWVIPVAVSAILTTLSALVTAYLGHRLYQSALHDLHHRKWSMATLYAISTLTIVALSIAGLFIPSLPVMLESAPLILGFWHLGEAIEHSLLDKINEKLDVRDCAAATVTLKDTSEIVSAKTLIPNDVIVVEGDRAIPVDGILLTPALLYTTKVDGSPYPKPFEKGATIKAGMTLAVTDTSLEMRVTKPYQSSYLSLIAQNIKRANAEKAPVERFANRVLNYFVPGLLAVAAVSGLMLTVFSTPLIALQSVLSILVSACPCALGLITPMAVKIGMKKSSDEGRHFKNGKALQDASDIDTVVFDLNGTLTEGKLLVKSVDIEDPTLLKYIARIEHHSNHPVAKTIGDYLLKAGVKNDPLLTLSDIDTSHHAGICAQIEGERYMVGSRDLLIAHGIRPTPPLVTHGGATIYCVKGVHVVGQFAISDPLRQDALMTVRQLQAMGKEVHLCTGADFESAMGYARLLGIAKEHVCANASGIGESEEGISKERYIQSLKAAGRRVAMVGDAANDLSAIQRADLGVAVVSSIGDKLTAQHAGMIVQQGLLFPIASALDIATKTKQNILQNLVVSLTYNSTVTLVGSGLFIGLGLTLNPAVGVMLMVFESLVVLGNLYRLKEQETLKRPYDAEGLHEVHAMQSTSKLLRQLTPAIGLDLLHDEQDTHRPNVAYSSPGFFDKPRDAYNGGHATSRATNGLDLYSQFSI